MADLKEAITKLFEVEFNNKPELFLHENEGENGYTLGGVYQRANPSEIDWQRVDKLMALFDNDIKRVSRMLFYDVPTMEAVLTVYHLNYWKVLQLSRVHSQKIANEIFLFGVVAGVRNGAEVAQRIVGVIDDGVIGSQSIQALNDFDAEKFDDLFDEAEIQYFEGIAEKNPRLAVFVDGWKNRAVYV